MTRSRWSDRSYLSASIHAWAGRTAWRSIICWSAVSSICARSGRSPLARPARNLLNVSMYVVWLTSVTCTSFCDELNRSVIRCSVSSLARCIECQNVISTGLLFAFFNALRGHFPDDCAGTAPEPGTARPTIASAVAAATAARRCASRDMGTPVLGTRSAFHSTGRESPHQLLLEDEQQDDQRERRQHRAGEGDVDLVDVRGPQLLEPDLHSPEAVVLGHQQRPQVLVPRRQERKDRERGERRAHQRDGNGRQGAQMAIAIELGRVVEVLGHL